MKTLAKGALVRIKGHHGCKGCAGRISRKAPEKIGRHTYYSVKLTGPRSCGKDTMVGWTMLFSAGELATR